jgi:uncharacterized protein YjbI with pentapeptide repeats
MPDVHAAVNAVSRLSMLAGSPRPYLSGVDLRRLTVDGSLRGAILMRSNLRFAILVGTDLRHAYLNWADLRNTALQRADLRKAVLVDADLTRADLRSANLRGAFLRSADLREADLTGADLRDAHNLDRARLEGAKADLEALWPAGFDPVTAGVTHSPEEPAS